MSVACEPLAEPGIGTRRAACTDRTGGLPYRVLARFEAPSGVESREGHVTGARKWPGRVSLGDRGHDAAGTDMVRNGHRQTPCTWPSPQDSERRIHDTVYLTGLTVADGAWLGRVLPTLLRNAHTEPGAVRIEDVALRYRSGRLGIADALDATAELLLPFAAAGADLERRNEWYICDDDENDDEDEDERPTHLSDAPDEDLLVSARFVVDAPADDAGSAALHWAVLGLEH